MLAKKKKGEEAKDIKPVKSHTNFSVLEDLAKYKPALDVLPEKPTSSAIIEQRESNKEPSEQIIIGHYLLLLCRKI